MPEPPSANEPGSHAVHGELIGSPRRRSEGDTPHLPHTPQQPGNAHADEAQPPPHGSFRVFTFGSDSSREPRHPIGLEALLAAIIPIVLAILLCALGGVGVVLMVLACLPLGAVAISLPWRRRHPQLWAHRPWLQWLHVVDAGIVFTCALLRVNSPVLFGTVLVLVGLLAVALLGLLMAPVPAGL